MKKLRPIVTSSDEVTLTRQSDGVIIQYVDSTYGTTHLQMPREAIEVLSDEEIIVFYNGILKEESARAAANPYVATEIPLNVPQIDYHMRDDQWTARGEVLRCLVSTTDDEREPMIEIDDKILSWQEFGRLLTTFSGWGMRIEFVPEFALHRRPALRVEEPD